MTTLILRHSATHGVCDFQGDIHYISVLHTATTISYFLGDFIPAPATQSPTLRSLLQQKANLLVKWPDTFRCQFYLSMALGKTSSRPDSFREDHSYRANIIWANKEKWGFTVNRSLCRNMWKVDKLPTNERDITPTSKDPGSLTRTLIILFGKPFGDT